MLLLIKYYFADANDFQHFQTDSIQIESYRIIENFPIYKYDAASLSNADVFDIRQLTGIIPGLYISDYGSRNSGGIYYRGLGNRHTGSGIAVYLDGVPLINGMESSAMFTDISELYLGKQGVSISGLGDLYLTSKSVMNTGTDIFLSYGNANTSRFVASHNSNFKDIY